jgi:hypothetical protein
VRPNSIVNALYEQRGFTSAATFGVACNYYF